MGLAITRYAPREGLEVLLLVANERNQEIIQRLIRANHESIAGRRYSLAMIEGVKNNDAGTRAITELNIADMVDDPFVNPISQESFEIFRKLPEHRGIQIEVIAARYIGALLFTYSLDDSTNNIDGILKIIFNGYTLDFAGQIKSHISGRRKRLGNKEFQEISLMDLHKLMKYVKETTEQRIAHYLGSCNGSVLVYCGKGYEKYVKEAIGTLRK